MSKTRIGTNHFIIPDTQVKAGVPLDHLTAAGNYIVDKKPDVIVSLGDHFDMFSLSSYDRGCKAGEGARYEEDIEAGRAGMEALLKPIKDEQRKQKRNKTRVYQPRMVFTLGNHEQRIERYVEECPFLEGKLTYADFELESDGWEVYPFLQPVCIDGVYYAHYFYNPDTSRPLGGMVETRLKTLGFSFTMGHQQGFKFANRVLNNGQVHRGLVVGSFYQHEEAYRGPQAGKHWNGCIMKHEVKDGNYCLMELSLDYLKAQWL